MAANGYGAHSPGGFSLTSVFIGEAFADRDVPLCDPRVHRRSRPEGLRPDRHRLRADADPSDLDPGEQHLRQPGTLHRVAFFNGNGAPAQLWLFWLAPIIGAVIAGISYAVITGANEPDISGEVSPAHA